MEGQESELDRLRRENELMREELAGVPGLGVCNHCRIPQRDHRLTVCINCPTTLCHDCSKLTGASWMTCRACGHQCCSSCLGQCAVPTCDLRCCEACLKPAPKQECAHRVCATHANLEECWACTPPGIWEGIKYDPHDEQVWEK